MHPTSRRLLRHLVALAAIPVTAVASLAMAASSAGIGTHLIELWLVGWITLLLVVLPATSLLGRAGVPGPRRGRTFRSPSPSSNRGQSLS